MKYIKYIITCILVIAGILISVTLYQYAVTGISTGAYVNFINLDKGEYEDRFSLLSKMFEEENLKYFIVDTVSQNNIDMEITLYSNDDVKREFLKKGYRECDFVTVTGTKIQFRYGTWEDYLNRELISGGNTIYFENYDESQVDNEYLRSNIIQTDETGILSLTGILACLWSGIFAVIFFFTLLDSYFSKKEYVLKTYYGWPCNRLVIRKIGINLLINQVIFWGLTLAFWKFSVLEIGGISVLAPFGIFSLADIIVYVLSMFNIDYKSVLGKVNGSKRLLIISYALNVISFCILILVLNFVYGQIYELYPLIAQKDFYTCFEGAYHVQPIILETGEEGNQCGKILDEEINENIYKNHVDDWNICQWDSSSITLELKENQWDMTDVILANKNAEVLIRKYITEYENYTFENDTFYIIIPEKLRNWEDDILNLRDIYARDEESIANPVVLYYQADIYSYAFSGMGDEFISDIEQLHNPVIFFDNYSDLNFADWCTTMCSYGTVIYADEDAILSETDTYESVERVEYTDIYGNYYRRLGTKIQNLIALMATLILAILLEILVTGLIIKNEHDMNAMEICISKINGMPLMVRYAKMLETTVFAVILSGILSELFLYIQTQRFVIAVFPISFACMVVEILLFSLQALKWEKKSINKILKGGAL